MSRQTTQHRTNWAIKLLPALPILAGGICYTMIHIAVAW